MKNYAFIAGYRRFWHNLHTLVHITTTEGTRTLTEAIQRLEQMAADIGLSVLPAMAILPNVLTLWFVLKPLMGTVAAIPLVATIEILPFVLAYHYFRSDDNRTLQRLLTGYYVIVFMLTIAFKVEGFNRTLAWLLLPSISVIAMLSYGKIRSLGDAAHMPRQVTAHDDGDKPETPVIDTAPTECPPSDKYPIRRKNVGDIEERRERVIAMRKQGMTIAQIAKELGVSRRTVQRDIESK